MSKLSDLIAVRASAQPYINFQDSLKNDSVCSGFVPVQSTLDVFSFLREATATHATSRAAICYGTYGSGKSRLCVVLARLFSEGFDAKPLAPVWDRMDKRGWGNELKKLRDIMCPGGRKWRPWLVVPMYAGGGGSSIANALLHSLIKAVKEKDLPDDVLGVTIYEAAARRIEHMTREGRTYSPPPKTPYPTPEMLSRALREDTSREALEFFKEWHKKETAGVSFEDVMKSQPDLVGTSHELYLYVADAVAAHGYEGIVTIWDEFGFAIEELLRGGAHGQRSIGQEVMELQDFVEHACSGDGLSGKVTFLGFTHVSLSEYGTRAGLNEQESNRLATVSGRFRTPDIPIRLSVTEAEGYHLLGGMKELTPKGSKILSNEFPCMKALAKRMPEFSLWERFSPEQCYNDIIRTTYPLHPAAASVLLMLSDRIAQVNRTAFYFMHDKDNGGVAGQLQDRELPAQTKIGSTELIRVHEMLQFFEQAIRQHDPDSHRQYEDALRRFPDRERLDEAVIRSVLILNVANVSPTTALLAFCLCDCTSEDPQAADLHSALERCAKANALWRNEATAVWDFARFSMDVEEPIDEELASIPKYEPAFFVRTEQPVQEEVAEYVGTLDMEPAKSGIVRRIRIEVLDIRDGEKSIKPINPSVKNPGEGWCSAAINIIVADTEPIMRAWRDWVVKLEPSCTYFLIPQTPVAFNEDVRRFMAIMNVLNKGNLDKSRREILDSMFTALRRKLREDFARIFGSEGFKSGNCSVMKAGSNAAVTGITCWNDLLMRVAEEASQQFSSEIKVRCGSYNEWQDGRSYGPIQKIVEHILSYEETGAYHTNYLGFKDTSREAAVVDGVLVENNYLSQDIHGKWVLGVTDDGADDGLANPIQLIRQHFTRGGGGEKPFVRLFSELIEPPYGIPNGVIPILVSCALREDIDRLALYVRRKGNSQRISKSDLGKHIALLGFSPDNYTTRYEHLAGKNRYVFKAVAGFLRTPFAPKEGTGEAFYTKCRDIRKELGEWAKGLQEVAVSSSSLTEAQRGLIKSLRGPIPPQLPELAESLVKLFCEDADCEAELREAGVATEAFPHMEDLWQELKDKLDRLTEDAQAPVRNLVERVTNDGQVSLHKVLSPLASGEGKPIDEAIKRVADRTPEDIDEVIGALCGKNASDVSAEDCGYVRGILHAAEQLRSQQGKVKLILPDRTVLLPRVEEESGRSELQRVLRQLREEFGLSSEHIARVVLDLLYLSNAGNAEETSVGGTDE